MDQSHLPLYEALLKHRKKNRFSFHVPGHKNGMVFNSHGTDIYRQLLSIDVTELSGLDDLHNTSGVIKEAEQLAANLFGSSQCFFLVGGSTVGNLAMIMATCKEGDTVLVQRNSHKSILSALELAKVTPVFLQPSFDKEAQVATCIDETLVLESIKMYPKAKALIITNPTYYGYTMSLEKIITEAHSCNIAVLVDEAHGTHFGHKSNLFPNSAIQQEADIVVQSAHKTLPAMTMSSFLHFNSQLVNSDTLKYYLQLFQSSSPSYPLMASLDLARHFLANLSEEDLKRTLEEIREFKNLISKIPQLKVITSDEYLIDPLKVTIQSQCELNGFQLQALLEEEGIYIELADRYNILLVLPLTMNTFNLKLVAEIMKKKLVNYHPEKVLKDNEGNLCEDRTSLAITYKQMSEIKTEIIPLEQSIGKIIFKEIIPYPPGIPFIMKGERISEKHIQALYELKKAGVYFQGQDVFSNGVEVFK